MENIGESMEMESQLIRQHLLMGFTWNYENQHEFVSGKMEPISFLKYVLLREDNYAA